MVLGVVGSRRRNQPTDKELIRKKIIELKPDVIVSGGCKKGGDKFAIELAKEMGIKWYEHLPKFPPGSPKWVVVKALFDRNTLVANDSDKLVAVVALDRKGGTEDTIKKFLKRKSKEDLILL